MLSSSIPSLHTHTLKTSNNSGWHLVLATWFESKASGEKSTAQTASRLLHKSWGRQRDFGRDTCFLHDLRQRWQTDASASHARGFFIWERQKGKRPVIINDDQIRNLTPFEKTHIKQSRSVSARRTAHRSLFRCRHFKWSNWVQMNKKIFLV